MSWGKLCFLKNNALCYYSFCRNNEYKKTTNYKFKNTTKQKTSKQISMYSTSITTTHKKTVNIESFTMPSKDKIETVLHVNFHKWL